MNVSIMKDKILKKCYTEEDQEVHFILEDGRHFKLFHWQSCCETVYIEDICGDLEDLVGSPLFISEEISNYSGDMMHDLDSYTWTFYKFSTMKGSVTIRFLGYSNGYYSESVDFEEDYSSVH